MKGDVYGYVRVSTDGQDTNRQVQEIVKYCKKTGLAAPRTIQETASGIKARPELERMLDGLRPGDTVIVWELSRLTRQSVSAVYAIVERIRKAGARLIESRSGTKINGTIESEAYVFALSLAARIERDLIAERTKSGLKAARERGVKLGRPKGSKLEAQDKEITRYLEMGINKSAIAKLVGCGRSTLIHYLESKKEAGKKAVKVKRGK